MDTQDLIDQQQAAVDKFFALKPAGCVLVIGDYSPNGGHPQWTYYVPSEQSEEPELVDEMGEEVWDTVELNDRNELRLSRTPARSVHRYRSYQWEPAKDCTGKVIDAYSGGQGLDWTEIKDFGDWLETECNLSEGSAGFDACMKVALAKAAELFG